MSVRWIDDEGFADEVQGRAVFCRVDMNVPLEDVSAAGQHVSAAGQHVSAAGQQVPPDGKGSRRAVADDERIRRALPTLRALLKGGARLVVASHLGRPKGKVKPELSLEPVAEVLQEALRQEIIFTDDSVGDGVHRLVSDLEPGGLLLLENLRFHAGEEKNDEGFARQLARDIDVYVNDAFGAAHRAHASTEGITHHVNNVAGGLLMRREVEVLEGLRRNPESPFVAVLGGAKVSDKIAVLSQLMNKVDKLIIGGAMAYTFLKAKGEAVGQSRVEEDRIAIASSILERAEEKKVEVFLPTDHVAAKGFAEDAACRVVPSGGFHDDEMGLDIGPETGERYKSALQDAKTIFWNGPMGVFEWARFSAGTNAVMAGVADASAFSVVGGGDSVAALNQAGRAGDVSHVSTGGGASLELLEGKQLPGLTALGHDR